MTVSVSLACGLCVKNGRVTVCLQNIGVSWIFGLFTAKVIMLDILPLCVTVTSSVTPSMKIQLNLPQNCTRRILSWVKIVWTLPCKYRSHWGSLTIFYSVNWILNGSLTFRRFIFEIISNSMFKSYVDISMDIKRTNHWI